MYHSLEIENFRCFEKLSVTDLARVNLIAGKNNSGKTALLEAVYLHATGGNAAPLADVLWGRSAALSPDSVKRPENVFRSLFSGLDLDRRISIHAHGSASGTWSGVPQGTLHLHDATDDAVTREKCIKERGSDAVATPILRCVATAENQEDQESLPFEVLQIDLPGFLGIAQRVWRDVRFIRDDNVDSATDAEDYGALLVEKRRHELLTALQVIEPELLAVELVPFVGFCGDVGLPRLLPLGDMGRGMAKLATLATALMAAAGGVVLIDEIENGFHHSKQQDVWRLIAETARRLDIQVFATTHSWECVVAAHEVFSQDGDYDFRLHRLQRVRDETHDFVYDAETLGAAIETGMEVR